MKNIQIPNLEEGVVFTIKGPFAHFRKFYTQTSALSYPIPPRTALSGIVGAILGIPRNEVYKLMQPPDGFFVLQILTSIRKITSTTNLVSTKKEFLSPLVRMGRIRFFDPSKNRTQIPVELLVAKPPERFLKFRIVFWHRDKKLLGKLINYLTEKKYFFPIYLGVSEFLAHAEFEGLTESLDEFHNYEGGIHSVVTSENVESGLVKPGNKFNVEHMLIYMHSDFSAKAYTNIIYSENTKPLHLRVKYALKWKDAVWAPYELFSN